MRPAIIIKKIKESELVYYEVSTVFEGFQCYIGVDAKHNRVVYFDFNFNPIGIIDFTPPGHLVAIPGIELWISNRVALQAYKALQKNVFLEDISISN